MISLISLSTIISFISLISCIYFISHLIFLSVHIINGVVLQTDGILLPINLFLLFNIIIHRHLFMNLQEKKFPKLIIRQRNASYRQNHGTV